MEILKLLSEEVFDFSNGQMTQAKARHLKDTMCNEFSEIFGLCLFVLENSQQPDLLVVTLDTMLRFLSWIPLGYVFETKIVETLVYQFFPVPLTRNVTLKCLTEIGSLNTGEQYHDQFLQLFHMVMTQLRLMLPVNTNIAAAYKAGTNEEQQFIQNLSLFLTGILKEHVGLFEKKQVCNKALRDSHVI
eukprot:Colp12_sorted_trinity150504_noHs@7574